MQSNYAVRLNGGYTLLDTEDRAKANVFAQELSDLLKKHESKPFTLDTIELTSDEKRR